MILLWLCITIVIVVVLYNRIMFRLSEKRYPPDGDFVTVEGVRLHYISKGTGQPIVFLHGGVLHAHDFDEVIELAASRGYRAIAFDRPGYGHSQRPRGERVTPRTQARLIHQALQKLEIDKPILVGHSWSGLLVLTYALDYPDDAAVIVTLGGGMYPEGYPAEGGDPISTVVTTPIAGGIFMNMMLRVLGPWLAERILKETFQPEQVPEKYRLSTRHLWLRPSQFRSNREDVLVFVPTAREVMHRYREITVPLIIVVGELDPFTTKEHSYRLHRDVPRSTLIVLEQAGHMIPHLHPEDIVQAIQSGVN